MSQADTSLTLERIIRWLSRISLNYLRRTKDFLLIYGDSDFIVSGYTVLSFQSNRDDFKFQLGYVLTLNGGTVNWKSSKQ